MHSTTFTVFAVIAICSEAFIIFLALFDRGQKYKVSSPELQPLDSDEFLCTLEAVCDSKLHPHTQTEVLTNGEVFYEAELDAIRRAQRSVCLEAYIFQPGEVSQRFVEALTERARSGVKVKIVLDALGSLSMTDEELKPLTDAGGQVGWYHPVRWNKWPHYNRRTHRELLVVDGSTAFIGGAGVADHWLIAKKDQPRWRDTMVRVHGEAVLSLQATFVENWLDCCGEIPVGQDFFPAHEKSDGAPAMVVNSEPSVGGASRARILFQMLVANAQKTIWITTPYFLPDESLTRDLVRAVKKGVDVRIVTPGHHSDHMLTRSSSRRLFGPLLEAGARIFSYEKAMIHAKILVVDGCWAVVGSTNFDNRSFGINDEVNLAARDRKMVARLEEDFRSDIAESREVTLEEWKRRSVFERATEAFGWVLERQQ